MAVALAVGLVGAGCSLIGGDDGPDPAPRANEFADAWEQGDLSGMVDATGEGGREIELAIRRFYATLQVAESDISVGEITVEDDTATAPLRVTHRLAGLGPWSYDTHLSLVRTEEDWAVDWSTAILHPGLVDGRQIERTRTAGERGPILDRNGVPLARGDAASRTAVLAPLTVGRMITVDATAAAELGPSAAAGDVAGGSGLEQAFNEELTGKASGSVQLVDGTGALVENLASFEGSDPQPLTTTIDSTLQRSADAAVAGSPLPVALVVLDVATGAVRAAANNPPGFDRAFLGEYPPGSTFKVITASAMLADGVAPDDRLPCPVETRPGDSRPFTNAFGKDGGVVTFRKAFAESCNTTFVNEGFRLGGETLRAEAELYGFNSGFNPGIPAVVGKYPLPESDTELAASSIGQGQVSASPLHMASVAAAARTGTWRAPFLVEPTPDLDRELAPGTATALTDFMRAVVLDEDGTATNVAVDGYDVGGKTGTAEFGNEEPPETHAWFIGFVDDLAYAVVVEAGGVGGAVAGPIVTSFIERLPQQAPDPAAPPAPDPTTTTAG